MKILVKDQWKDGFLDEALTENAVRIHVSEWVNLHEINGLYFIPKRHGRVVFNYVKEIGVKAVFAKIKSRLLEVGRNDKFLSCGTGIVGDSTSQRFKTGTPIFFLAPCHPRCMERIVLDENLVLARENGGIQKVIHKGLVSYRNLSPYSSDEINFTSLIGWSRYSGDALPSNISQLINCLNESVLLISTIAPVELTLTPVQLPTERSLPITIAKNNIKKPMAVIFGYGQYAKTSILPNIKKYLAIDCIHEIDPTQIGAKTKELTFDTSPTFRDFEKPDICFIAGFHHTHAPLVIEALHKGINVVSEKPIVTNWDDFNHLVKALSRNGALFYSAFQKRYSIFNDYAYKDLAITVGEPISYHCIVYETPLPTLHWYRWPNSNSRITSNACHWIDHFLFLNGFIAVQRKSLNVATNGDVNIFIELVNGAVFSMALTEVGAERIGVQDYIELRAKTATVKITNSSYYVAENSQKVIRKVKINKLSVYGAMYKKIAENFTLKKGGDSIESVRVSAALILELEDEFKFSMEMANS